MIKLTAIYNERFDGKWDAYIEEAPHINLVKAEDLKTAKEFLPIICAEEVAQMWKVRVRWGINREVVNHFDFKTY